MIKLKSYFMKSKPSVIKYFLLVLLLFDFSLAQSSLNQVLREIERVSATSTPSSLEGDSVQNDFRLSTDTTATAASDLIGTQPSFSPVKVPVNFAKTLSSIYKNNEIIGPDLPIASVISEDIPAKAVAPPQIPQKSGSARRMTSLPKFDPLRENNPYSASAAAYSSEEPVDSSYGTDKHLQNEAIIEHIVDPLENIEDGHLLPVNNYAAAALSAAAAGLPQAGLLNQVAQYSYQYPAAVMAYPVQYIPAHVPVAGASTPKGNEGEGPKKGRGHKRRRKRPNPLAFIRGLFESEDEKDPLKAYSELQKKLQISALSKINEDVKLASLSRMALDIALLRNSIEGGYYGADRYRRRPPPPRGGRRLPPHLLPPHLRRPDEANLIGAASAPGEGVAGAINEPKKGPTGPLQNWPRIFTILGSNLDTMAGNINIVRKELSKMRGQVISNGLLMGGSAVHEVSKGMAHVVMKMSHM